jgi:hypothetical protein
MQHNSGSEQLKKWGKLNGPNGGQEHGGNGNATVAWPDGETKVSGAVVKAREIELSRDKEQKKMDIRGKSTAEESFVKERLITLVTLVQYPVIWSLIFSEFRWHCQTN